MRLLLACLAVAAMAGLTPASAGVHALERATADRADDVSGPQIHVVYAVPADGEDRALDTNGAIARSVRLFVGWLADETGGPTLRVDTYQGELDVTFVRLEQSDAQLAARGAFVREGIEEELSRRGLLGKPDRIYDVYYDGTSTYSCGGAFWPPQLNGRVVAMYLRGLRGGPVPCEASALGGGAAGYWEFAMLHDTLHGLGLVQTCARHHTLAGHVSDAPNDLMWAGGEPWQLPPKLDIGRDDYYGHGRADCPDLANSPYLTSVAPPTTTPILPARTPAIVSQATARARAGAVFRATLTLDAAVDSVTCSARLAGRVLRATKRIASGKTAVCAWRLPPTARGKRLTGSVEARSGFHPLARSFAVTVR